ncbi:MAG: RNA methyltransferase [Clostridia bacterium]|nr:RNA methyltransferase [Clostridia bacterium]
MFEEIFGVETITSKTNSTIVKIAKLSNKKYRNEEKLFVCDGKKLLIEAINFGAEIKYIIIKNDIILDDELIETIKKYKKNGTIVLCVSSQVFAKLTEESAPQGIITVCKFLEKQRRLAIVENANFEEKIMMFESIRDPGNIGTIIRNAAAFGIDRLIFSSDCADIYSTKVIRAAMGAIFKVKIDIVDDFKGSLLTLKKNGKRILSATLGKKSLILGKDELLTNDVVIIGNEGHGISEEIVKESDQTILIPMCENTESLNAAIATSIFMWEYNK